MIVSAVKMIMSKRFFITLFLTGLLLPLYAFAANDEVKADVAISIQHVPEIWAGQQVTLNLDLKTTGFSFSNSHFNLPEIPGAFLMQTDTTTVKFTENLEGQTWQIIRYPLALYPQTAGNLEIPPIAVRFISSAKFGSVATPFEFQTKPLVLTIKQPPGVKEGDLVITTKSFELDYEWQPKSGTGQTGSAYTLTVKRRAADISAMLLPPLPVFRIEGLAAYSQAPEINDETDRGDLVGERVDSIIWVAEKPGVYDIPGIRFQWWDPDSRELKQQIIPGLNLDIQSTLTSRDPINGVNRNGQSGQVYYWLLVVLFTAFITFFFRLFFIRKPRMQSVDTEKASFKILKQTCKNNQAALTHSAMHTWLSTLSLAYSSGSRQVTLMEFAQACNDTQLTAELGRLQEAVISPDSPWRGGDLFNALQIIRQKIKKHQSIQLNVHLAPLNP